MAVRLVHKSWWVDFTVNCTRHRKRSPDNSRAGALVYEATLRQQLIRGEPLDTLPTNADYDQTFATFAKQWFEQYVVANNKYSEQYAKKKILEATLVPFFGKMSLKAINGGHIEQYKLTQIARGATNKTINNRLTVLSKCLRCAHEWYGTPMPIIKLLKCPPPRTDYLTMAECEALLSHAEGQLREMLFLALRTGMRQGEIRGLQWPSIDWQNRSLAVRHSRCDRNRSLVAPKNNRERHIPLDSDLYEMLFRKRQNSGYVFRNAERHDEPFTSHRLIEALEPICEKAQLRKITWHVLRHTFATQLTLRGVPLTVVRELLGHSSITTTMRYSHVAPSVLRSAIEMLNPKNGGVADFGQPAVNNWQKLITGLHSAI
jgi:integrase